MKMINAKTKMKLAAMGKLNRTFKLGICLLLLQVGQVQGAQSITFFHNDVLGSPVAVTDINGDLCWREDYQPYGEKRLNNDDRQPGNPLCGLDDNQRGYTNHVHDKDIGLTYMQARYYDPAIGRFMGIDPVGIRLNNQASFNRFAYGNNNPYFYRDPDGEQPIGNHHGNDQAALNAANMRDKNTQENPHSMTQAEIDDFNRQTKEQAMLALDVVMIACPHCKVVKGYEVVTTGLDLAEITRAVVDEDYKAAAVQSAKPAASTATESLVDYGRRNENSRYGKLMGTVMGIAADTVATSIGDEMDVDTTDHFSMFP